MKEKKRRKKDIKKQREQTRLPKSPAELKDDTIIKNIPVILETISASTSPKLQTDNMDVHHHTHHSGKKNWKSYFWEFLMLFLAVFCGFLAEYQLEHVIENTKEKEYIVSMITDAENDTVALNKAIIKNTQSAIGLDSLANLCYEFEYTSQNVQQLYRLFGNYAAYFESARFTDRTRAQLKSSGNLRLIKNKSAADNITLYDNSISDVLTQEGSYAEFMKDQIKVAQQLFNFKYFQQRSSKLNQAQASAIIMSVLTKNPVDLIQYGN
ncbi:MAG: hypothetical protein ACXWCZ_10255, partial [Flavisolibacter sp.]